MRIFLAAFLTMLCTNLYAIAGMGLKDVIPSQLKESDIILMMEHSRVKLDNKPVGSKSSWNNPQSKNSGTVTLMRKFNHKHTECRTVEHSVNLYGVSDRFNYKSTICKNRQGKWVNLP